MSGKGFVVFGCFHPALSTWGSSQDVSCHGHTAEAVKRFLPRPLGGISEARKKARGRGLHCSNQQLLQSRA